MDIGQYDPGTLFLVAVYTSLHCLGYVLDQTYVCFKFLNLCDPGCLSPNCPQVSNMFKKKTS